MLQQAIDTYEELKKHVFVIDRGTKGKIYVRFTNGNFYHLLGLQYTGISHFFPKFVNSKAKAYKYLSKNTVKFNKILLNEIIDKSNLFYRISTFPYINDLFYDKKTLLYDLTVRPKGSLFDGEYGLSNNIEQLSCLLGLKISNIYEKNCNCFPQSWMVSDSRLYLIQNKKAIYVKCISIE